MASQQLFARLADLRAAENLLDIPAPINFRETSDGELCEFSLDLNHVLTFTCNHKQVPRKPSGQIDWQYVTRIKIMYLGAV